METMASLAASKVYLFISWLYQMLANPGLHWQIHLLTDFCEKFRGRKGACWWWAFKRFLNKQDPFPRHDAEKETFWSKAGGLSPDTLKGWDRKGVFIPEDAKGVISRIQLGETFFTTELVAIPEEEMWLDSGSLEEVVRWGRDRGFALCPQFAPLEFVLETSLGLIKLDGAYVFVTPPFTDSSREKPVHLVVGKEAGRDETVIASTASNHGWIGTKIYVFALPKK